MVTTQFSGSISLQPGGTLHFLNHARSRLSFNASSGFLWLTRDGDIQDYLLRAGDAISLCAGDNVWLTLEQAHDAASLSVEPLDTPRPLRDAAAALLTRFAVRPTQPCHAEVQFRSM